MKETFFSPAAWSLACQSTTPSGILSPRKHVCRIARHWLSRAIVVELPSVAGWVFHPATAGCAHPRRRSTPLPLSVRPSPASSLAAGPGSAPLVARAAGEAALSLAPHEAPLRSSNGSQQVTLQFACGNVDHAPIASIITLSWEEVESLYAELANKIDCEAFDVWFVTDPREQLDAVLIDDERQQLSK